MTTYYDLISGLGYNFILTFCSIIALVSAKNNGKGYIPFIVGLVVQGFALYIGAKKSIISNDIRVAVYFSIAVITLLLLLSFKNKYEQKKKIMDESKGEQKKENNTVLSVNQKAQASQMTLAKMSFCRICGKKLVDGSRFCVYCGAEVVGAKEEKPKIVAVQGEERRSFRIFARYDYQKNTVNIETAALHYEELEMPYVTKLTEFYKGKQFQDVIRYGEELLNKYQIPMEANNAYAYCFSYQDKFSLYLLLKKEELNKDLVWNAERLSEVLSIMGSSSIELKDLDSAEGYLAGAAEMDPTNVDIHCEYAFCLINQKKHKEAEDVLKGVFRYCSRLNDFARLYRTLGSIYVEKGLFDLGETCYIWSMFFLDSAVAKNEILYIEQELKKHDESQRDQSVKKLSKPEYCKTIMDVNDVPYIVDSKVFEMLKTIPDEEYSKLCNTLTELEIVSE